MRTRHWHVLLGMPGYMPDSNEIYRTRRAAEWGAKFFADEFRDDPEHYRVTGNMRDGYVIERKEAIHALPFVIEIAECSEADCLDGEEDW